MFFCCFLNFSKGNQERFGMSRIKENSKCFETVHYFWEIKGIPSRIPHGQTNLGHCCDANSAQHIPVSPSTSHGNSCAGTTDKNHTESRTQLLKHSPSTQEPFEIPHGIPIPTQSCWGYFFKDLERQGCCVNNGNFSSKLPEKPH